MHRTLRCPLGLAALFVAAAMITCTARPAAADDLAKLGAETYAQICVACHMPDGKGIAKVNPPLAGSDWVTAADPGRAIRVVLHGLQGAIKVNNEPYFGLMPGLGSLLTDQQVAAVLTHTRSSFGNKAAPVSVEQVAAVRRAFDGRTEPWSLEDLANPTPKVEPADPGDPAGGAGGAVGAVLSDLRYRYYEGNWTRLPDFAKLTPVAEGAIADNVITLKPAKRSTAYGFVYWAKLTVAKAGRYAFSLDSDDGSRLLIDGKVVVEFDGAHPAGNPQHGIAELTAGEHAFELQYFQAGGPVALTLGMSGPGVNGVWLTEGRGAPQAISDPRFVLSVLDRPLVLRANMPDASSRAIAVGLLNGVHHCFDATTCTVRYGWFGRFLDTGANRGNGSGRGGAPCKVLGKRFDAGDAGKPLAIGDGEQTVRFLGYARTGDAPTFRYKVNATTVSLTVRGATEGLGLTHSYALDPTPDAPVKITFKRAGLTVTSSAGTWDGDTLTLAPADAKAFSVTVLAGQ